MQILLKDKIVLITGGSRGIGAAIVEAFSETKATIAVHYGRNQAAAQVLADNAGNNSDAFQADLKYPEECRKLVRKVKDRYGKIDVLVNNAGIALEEHVGGDFEEWLNVWQETLQVNLIASAILSREVIPLMQKQGGGQLIHISSRAAFRGDTAEYMAYAASKGGMVALSRSLARAYGKDGIKSYIVAPGFTRTEMAQQFIDEYGEEFATNDIALPSLTEPADVASTVVFLASGKMDHATGCTIDINAGSYVH